MYKLLKKSYMANLIKEERSLYQKEMMIHIKMLDFYLRNAYKKKLLSQKQLIQFGDHLLQIYKMLVGWIKSEKKKESVSQN